MGLVLQLSNESKFLKVNYQKTNSTDYYDPENFKSILGRLEKIQPDSERKWGSMTVSQMLHHLNLAIGSCVGYYDLPDVSNFISRGIIRLLILNVLKRFPRGAQTAKTLKVSAEFDFDTEKKLLKEILTKAYNTKTNEDWMPHTYFGKMSREEWGKLIMIHCNHHFQQFSN